jgi:hypothetical protein
MVASVARDNRSWSARHSLGDLPASLHRSFAEGRRFRMLRCDSPWQIPLARVNRNSGQRATKRDCIFARRRSTGHSGRRRSVRFNSAAPRLRVRMPFMVASVARDNRSWSARHSLGDLPASLHRSMAEGHRFRKLRCDSPWQIPLARVNRNSGQRATKRDCVFARRRSTGHSGRRRSIRFNSAAPRLRARMPCPGRFFPDPVHAGPQGLAVW